MKNAKMVNGRYFVIGSCASVEKKSGIYFNIQIMRTRCILAGVPSKICSYMCILMNIAILIRFFPASERQENKRNIYMGDKG